MMRFYSLALLLANFDATTALVSIRATSVASWKRAPATSMLVATDLDLNTELVTFTFDEHGKAQRLGTGVKYFGLVTPTAIVKAPARTDAIKKPITAAVKSTVVSLHGILSKLQAKRRLMRLKREGESTIAIRERVQAAYAALTKPIVVLEADVVVAAEDVAEVDVVVSWYDQGIRLDGEVVTYTLDSNGDIARKPAGYTLSTSTVQVAPAWMVKQAFTAACNRLRLEWARFRIGSETRAEEDLTAADIQSASAAREVEAWDNAFAMRCTAKSAETWEPSSAVDDAMAWAAETKAIQGSAISAEAYAAKRGEIAVQAKVSFSAQARAEAALEIFEAAQAVSDAARTALQAALAEERAALAVLAAAARTEQQAKEEEERLHAAAEKLKTNLAQPAATAMAYVEWPAIGGKAPHPMAGTC